jgi:aminoglycoside phosphotransferase (APT) family kinase protein
VSEWSPAPSDNPDLDPETLSWLVSQASGEEIAVTRRNRESGRGREVHEVVTASGARLMIRGEGVEGIGLDQEAWSLARAREAGVPVPDVLWLGTADTAAGQRTVMVQTAATGQPLGRALPGMSAAQRRSAARSCGQVIARLHSVRVGGFYRRHDDGAFEYADFAALQAADLAHRLGNLRVLAGAGLTTEEAAWAETLLPEAVAARGDGPAVLCHGELYPAHIFITTGESDHPTVSGLIDWSDACGGRPLHDLEVLCWSWPEVDRAALADGYGPAPIWDDGGRRLALGQLRMLIGYAAHDLRAGQPARADGYLTAIKALLASTALRPGASGRNALPRSGDGARRRISSSRRSRSSTRRSGHRSTSTFGSPPSTSDPAFWRSAAHQVPGTGSGHGPAGSASPAAIPASSARSRVSRDISRSISPMCCPSSVSAGPQGQTPVSRTASSCRISASRSPSRCAPRMNSIRSRSAAPYRR